MKEKIKPELLAPAGDLERLKIALHYGADAVYIGGPAFGLRANANNFTLEEIKEGILFAHERNKKVYVTVNIVLHKKELLDLKAYLEQLEAIGVDAIIISDPAVLEMAKKYTNLEIHISTQQSTTNKEAVVFWKAQGASRIVLARETTKEDILDIKYHVPIEIECFIHGAMCASYSGRCVLSNFLTARDSNRGGCSQICRWDFKLSNSLGEPIQGDKDFTFCTKDLSMLEFIPTLIDMGVTSFKIEGRMRSIYYIATVVDIYRRVIDQYCQHPTSYEYNKEYEKVLRNCANRDSVPQFFHHNYDHSCQYYNGREEVSNQDFLGVVLNYDPMLKKATIEQRNYFKKGDKVEIFGPNHDLITTTIMHIYDDSNQIIEIVRHPRQIVTIILEQEVYPGDLMRIRR